MGEQPHRPPAGTGSHCAFFVHAGLAPAFFANPARALEVLGSPTAQQSLEAMWRGVGDERRKRGETVASSSAGLGAEPAVGDGWKGVVVRLPPPEVAGDCALVLLMVPSRPVTDGQFWRLLEQKGAPVARCFSLEMVQSPGEAQGSLRLCELSTLLGHVRTGYTSTLDPADFVREAVASFDVE